MKALVKSQRAPGIWMEEVPEPKVGPNDVRVKVHKTAICGTDIHIYNWDQWAQKTIPVPMHVGHEYAGEIVEVGSEVRDAFLRHDPIAAAAFTPSLLTEDGDKFLADIYQLARQRLQALGITQIYGGSFCTYTDRERFFSYRRDGQTGRMATMIWMA